MASWRREMRLYELPLLISELSELHVVGRRRRMYSVKESLDE